MLKKYLIIITSLAVFFSCSSETTEPSGGGNADNFDRGALLENVADNIIIPAFQNLHDELVLLNEKAKDFSQNPSSLTLGQVKTYWLSSYKAWQQVAMFDIGKAEQLQFVNHFNIYPVTVADIEQNITSGSYDLKSSNNHDAQGFPAIDYLLFGIGSDEAQVLQKFTTDANADGYKKYLTDITAFMETMIAEIMQDWQGNFRADFIASTSNTATSSLNKLINDYIFYYEKRLRANKFGIPAGNFSSTALPEKVEAFYKKDISKELALEGLDAVQNLFLGQSFGNAAVGESFKTYLVSLNKSDLASKIEDQFTKAKNQINKLNNNFYEQIKTDNTEMTMAYDELQKAVVLLKVDMLQVFNISVDFVDADGD